jgi:hypothetical protein
MSWLAPAPDAGDTPSQDPPESVLAVVVNAPSAMKVVGLETWVSFTVAGAGAVLPDWVKNTKFGLTLSRCAVTGMQERIEKDRRANKPSLGDCIIGSFVPGL